MARRFGDILKGPELQKAYTEYTKYLALDRTGKRKAYATNLTDQQKVVITKTEPIAIRPFLNDRAKFYLLTKRPKEAMASKISLDPQKGTKSLSADSKAATAITNINAILGSDYFLGVIPNAADDVVLDMAKYRFARMIYTTGADTFKSKESRFTKRQYLSRDTSSVSHPFGRGEAADKNTFAEVVKLLTVAAKAKKGPNDRISFKPELGI